MEVEDPVRRVRGKSTLSQLLLTPRNEVDRKAKDLLDHERYDLENVVEMRESLKPYARTTTRTTQGEGLQWLVGQYTHGGQCGVTLDSDKLPIATSYLARAFSKLTGIEDFTSILMTEDVGMQIHRDVHNRWERQRPTSSTTLLPCEQGGGVWVESEPGEA